MGWADYGFPDIRMMSNSLPIKALHLAQKERLIDTDTSLLHVSTDKNTRPDLNLISAWRWRVQPGSKSIWTGGSTYAFKYINPTIDFDKEVDIAADGNPDILLNEDVQIKKIIEDRDTTGSGYIGAGFFSDTQSKELKMLPEWPRVWAEQRYLAYNLLKLCEVPLKITYLAGDSYRTFRTPEEAYAEAVSRSRIYTTPIGSVGQPFIHMYTYIGDGGTTTKSYFCMFIHIMKIEVDYTLFPSLRNLPAFIYLSPRTSDTDTFDIHGLPIKSADNVMSIINLPWEINSVSSPDHGLVEGSFGFLSKKYWYVGVVDASSLFEFYDNVDKPK